MSSTGFFHSRLCGTLADVGCWAFILGAFVIHPPKKTQPPPKSISWGPGAAALGTYDAGLFLHSLLNNAISFLFTTRTRRQAIHKFRSDNAAPIPLSEQYEEPSIPYCVKLR